MARRHVLRDRRVLVRDARAHVARNPLALVEDLDGAIREVNPERHDSGRDGAAHCRSEALSAPAVETGEEIVAALLQMLHHLRVDLRYAVANGVVQLDKEKKRLLRSLPSTKREPMLTAASTLALSRSQERPACAHEKETNNGAVAQKAKAA
jgi:hypothetical protein